MGRTGRCLASALLCAALAPALADGPASADLSPYFGGLAGCALIDTRDRYREQRLEYRPGQCRQGLSPCSTFKLPNALIGLETGAVSGPDHLKAWDGLVRERAVTNRDHTLASAIEHSVVWYFQDLAHEVGPAAMQAWLDRLGYGNRDISGGIDRFWLGSSLQIDAYQQLIFIEALWRDGLPFASRHQAQLRDMLRQDSPLAGALHGKTGSCLGDPALMTQDHGWFVGWIDWDRNAGNNPATSWFVINIVGEGARGSRARDIALRLLVTLEPCPPAGCVTREAAR